MWGTRYVYGSFVSNTGKCHEREILFSIFYAIGGLLQKVDCYSVTLNRRPRRIIWETKCPLIKWAYDFPSFAPTHNTCCRRRPSTFIEPPPPLWISCGARALITRVRSADKWLLVHRITSNNNNIIIIMHTLKYEVSLELLSVAQHQIAGKRP